MAITRTPIIDDDGSGTTGTVLDNAWKQELYGQIDGVVAAAGGTPWAAMPPGTSIRDDTNAVQTMNIIVNRYRTLGNNTLLWELSANPITLANASSNLYLVHSGPFNLLGPAGAAYPVAFGGPATSYLNFSNSATLLWKRSDGANWAAGTAWLYFSIMLEASGG